MTKSNLALLFSFGCITVLALSGNANVIPSKSQTDEISYQYCTLDATTSQVNCLASVFRFTADVSRLQSRAVESTNITLNNLSWTVQLSTRTVNNVEVVDITLKADSETASIWSTEAEATIKLHPKIGTNLSVVQKKIEKTKFTHEEPERSIKAVVTYSDFKTYYVNEDMATLEIALSTVPLAEKDEADVDVIKTRLHVMLDNVRQLTKSETPEILVRGIRWKVVVERLGGNVDNVSGALAIHLEAAEQDFGNSLSYNVDVQFTMLTFVKTLPAATSKQTQVFHWGASNGTVVQLLTWENFSDVSKKFVLNNRANLLVEFRVAEPKNLWDFYDTAIQA